MLHEFSRTELLIGAEGVEKLKKSRVAIFGIGGVGSFAAEGLVRSGIGKFVLVDDDVISPTNINRQIHATSKTVDRPKVEVMKERMLEINPKAEIETYQCFYMPDDPKGLIRSDYDYIIDAIDTVTAKIGLVLQAKKAGLPIISSMGAGNKMDPTKFEVSDIYSTSICPLAKVMRKELRQRNVESLKVVYSREKPIKPIDSEKSVCRTNSKCPEDTAKKNTIRRQAPGSISFVPSVAGLIIAGEVIKDIINWS